MGKEKRRMFRKERVNLEELEMRRDEREVCYGEIESKYRERQRKEKKGKKGRRG